VVWFVLQVLFVDVKLRLVDDIGILWQSVTNSLNTDSAVGLVSHPDCKEPSVNQYMTTQCLPLLSLFAK